jgi:uncharacterized membrane protein
MRRVLSFIKTTAIGGLLVIIPVTIILAVLAQVFYGLFSIVKDVLDELPLEFDEALVAVGITVLALIGLCFVTGLIVQTQFGMALKGWFSRNVARRIPMYNAITNLTKRFVGVEGLEFAPVEVAIYNSNSRVLGFLIEELPEDRAMVYVPSAPVATIGNIFIVPVDDLTHLDASTADAISVMTQWGVDARMLYAKK